MQQHGYTPGSDHPVGHTSKSAISLELPPTERAQELHCAILESGLEISGQQVIARLPNNPPVNVSELVRALEMKNLRAGTAHLEGVEVREIPAADASGRLVCAIGKDNTILEISPAQIALVRELTFHVSMINAAADAFQADRFSPYLALIRLATKDHPNDPLLTDAMGLFTSRGFGTRPTTETLDGMLPQKRWHAVVAHFSGSQESIRARDVIPPKIEWVRLADKNEALARIAGGETVAVWVASKTFGWANYGGLYIDGKDILSVTPHAPNPNTYWLGFEDEGPQGSDLRYLVSANKNGRATADAPLMREYATSLSNARSTAPPDRWRDARREQELFEAINEADLQVVRTLSTTMSDVQNGVTSGRLFPSAWHLITALSVDERLVPDDQLRSTMLANLDLLYSADDIARAAHVANSRREELIAVVSPNASDYETLVPIRNELRPKVKVLHPSRWYGTSAHIGPFSSTPARLIEGEAPHFVSTVTDSISLNCDPRDCAAALFEVVKRLATASPFAHRFQPALTILGDVASSGMATKEQLAKIEGELKELTKNESEIRDSGLHHRFASVVGVLKTWKDIVDHDLKYSDGKCSFNGSYRTALNLSLLALYKLRFPKPEYRMELDSEPSVQHFAYVRSISNWVVEGILRHEQFRSLDTDIGWLSPEVQDLVRTIRKEGVFYRIPELAPALKRAGCHHPYVDFHCSGPGPYVASDAILQKLSPLVPDQRDLVAANESKPASRGWLPGFLRRKSSG